MLAHAFVPVVLFGQADTLMELECPMSDRVLRLKEVCERVGLKRSSVYLAMSKGRFPSPIRLGERAVGWRESTITGWLDARPDAREKAA
jgi:prophage regulatory protein